MHVQQGVYKQLI